MGHTPVGATAALAAVGGYAALYRLGQTWGATGEERQQPLAGDELLPRQGLDHPCDHDRGAYMRSGRGWCRWAGDGPAGTPTAGSTGSCSRPTAPAPTASFPGTSGCVRAISPRRPAGGRLLVHRGAAGGGRLLVLRSTRHLPLSWRQRAGDGLDLELAPGRADRWVCRSSSATGCACTHGGSSGRSWPRSSRRTSSWLAATCAACSDGPRRGRRAARRPATGRIAAFRRAARDGRLDVVERLGRSAA